MAYGEVLARNVRGQRTRKGIGQKSLAARMRALGYTAWFTQTVGKAERGERRITSEEVLGLAYALEVTVRQLLAPQPDDKRIQLPSGDSVDVLSVQRMLAGENRRRHHVGRRQAGLRPDPAHGLHERRRTGGRLT